MSRFSGLLNKAQATDNEPTAAPAAPPTPEPTASLTAPHSSPTSVPTPRKATRRSPTAEVRMGRPAGKRSDPQTIQVTAYIQETTHIQAKMKLLADRGKTGNRLDFSGLVQKLLTDWLAS